MPVTGSVQEPATVHAERLPGHERAVLTDQEAHRRLRHRRSPRELPSLAGLVQRIAVAAVGNPFFVEEIVRDLADRGVRQILTRPPEFRVDSSPRRFSARAGGAREPGRLSLAG